MTRPFDEALLAQVDAHIEHLFVPMDAALEQCLADSREAGLPDICVSPNLGKLLNLVARLVKARRVLEIGTLGGYSAIWLARALPADGRLVTLELEPANAGVARGNIERCGLSELVEVRVGPATALMRAMVDAREDAFDLVFIDANKEEYPAYLELGLELSHPGTVILADNVIRGGEVLDASSPDPLVRGIEAFNRAIAAHPRLDSLILPVVRKRLDGLSLSIVR